MSFKKTVSLFALCSFAAFSVAACTADTTDPSSDAPSASGEENLKASTLACTTDADCVAVPQGGCCDNGFKAAVNKHHTKDYANATKCTTVPHPVCPMFLVDDTRLAECNVSKHKCEMVAIDDIACGGFTMNPHKCPDGYSCGAGKVVDAPGKCEKNDEPSDCRSTGCEGTSTCQMCWGNFACVPKGAEC